MEIRVQELTPETFSPFGTVIEQPTRTQDAQGPGWTWWGENAFLEGDSRPYGIGYLDLTPADMKFDWAERHMRSMELIIPAGGDCLIYVGPPEHLHEPGRLPDLGTFQAFRIREGQAALLDRGVWHGAPLAIDRPAKAIVLLHKDTGIEDGHVVRFEDRPVSLIV